MAQNECFFLPVLALPSRFFLYPVLFPLCLSVSTLANPPHGLSFHHQQTAFFPRPHQSAHPQSTVQARAMWALPLPITHLLRGNPSVLWDSQFCRSKSPELRSGVNGQCAAGNGFPLSGGPRFCPWEPPLGTWELSARRTCVFPVQCSPGHCRLKEFMCPFQNMKYMANLQHHWVPLPLPLQKGFS